MACLRSAGSEHVSAHSCVLNGLFTQKHEGMCVGRFVMKGERGTEGICARDVVSGRLNFISLHRARQKPVEVTNTQ